jgi:hypothetical protein
MFKYYCEKLFKNVTSNFKGIAEDVFNLFLGVRGYATTRLVRKQLKFSKTKSVSLRGGLKSLKK